MNSLIFLTNELLNPKLRHDLKLPLEFISYGIMEGRMYRHYGGKSNFVVPNDTLKHWGNNVVYGALFICKDFDFYNRVLDAYHICSLSTLLRNHNNDIHHRVEQYVTPIFFETLNELALLKYREGKPIKAITYMGNIKHNKISQRLNKTVSYRIKDGIDAENFKQLFWEVKHGKK